MTSNGTLEQLLDQYETAYFADQYDDDEVQRLSEAVEAEAKRIGYDNHFRLAAYHDMAEQYGQVALRRRLEAEHRARQAAQS